MVTITDAYILTPNAKKAIIRDLEDRIQELRHLTKVAGTKELKAGIQFEISDLMTQMAYYSDFSPMRAVCLPKVESCCCESI